MPQIFHVLRCYKCMVFQVHQTKKSSKFQCKLCGEKQSIKRHYGIGTAKDCRLHVQRLNGIRGEIDALAESISDKADTDDDNDDIEEIDTKVKVEYKKTTKSKWSDFIDNKEETNESSNKETMYLNNTEVVLEVPKKRKKTFKCPVRKTTHEDDLYVDPITSDKKIQDISNLIDSFPRYQDSEVNKTTNRIIENNSMTTITSQTFVPKNCTPDTQFKEDFPLSNTVMKTDSTAIEKESSVPVKVSSKWAQFIAEEECLDNDQECDNDIPYDNDHELNDSQELFALCDDDDLDAVLRI